MDNNKTRHPNLINVGRRIKRAREERGLSQEKLGEAVSKSQRTISDIERGTLRLFLDDLYLLADTLGKPVVYFLEDDIRDDDMDVVLMREIRQLPTKEAKQTMLRVVQAFKAFFTPES